MKFITLIILFIGFFVHANSSELSSAALDTPWRLERSNFYFENDVFSQTDSQYSAGWKLSNVYFAPASDVEKLPFIADANKIHFVSIGLSLQIYTPNDLNVSEVILDDRPYAGWLYLEVGLHESSQIELHSFVVQVGVVGKLSGGEATQKVIHRIIGNDAPMGWDNQLRNELGVNLMYQHKWRYTPHMFLGLESNIIPFVSASLGNVTTDVNSGAIMRFGWNPIVDFGSSPIDIGGENGIPTRSNNLCSKHEPWSFTFNFSASGQAIAHNVFLDGNTFNGSHWVEKENFIAYGSYGFTARYKHFVFDYINTATSKHFKEESSGHNYGTILFSYLY